MNTVHVAALPDASEAFRALRAGRPAQIGSKRYPRAVGESKKKYSAKRSFVGKTTRYHLKIMSRLPAVDPLEVGWIGWKTHRQPWRFTDTLRGALREEHNKGNDLVRIFDDRWRAPIGPVCDDVAGLSPGLKTGRIAMRRSLRRFSAV